MPKQPAPVVTIGSKESIDFPAFGLHGIPAKVDTGADSSAVWASDIREENGKLSFCLFDTSSPFYTGETITAAKYSVSSIKNSFGHAEFRYKVPLKVTIAGRTINVRFTLANRENNRYPILIGRRTLSGKFLVDVARGHDRQQPYQVLLITIKRTPRIEAFIKKANRINKNVHITLALYDELQFTIGKTCQVVLVDSGQDIALFDLVHFKATPHRRKDVAVSAAQYLKKRRVPFIDSAISMLHGSSKLYQYVVLHNNDIKVPASVFVSHEYLADSYELFAGTVGTPFVLKDIYGSRGRANFLIANEQEFVEAAKEIIAQDLHVIAQQYIYNEGDYRLLSFGRKISLVIHRQRTNRKTHLNNTSQGGKATLVPLEDIPAIVQQDSILAGKLLDREIAGVDMVQDQKTGDWYCLEVNEDPQIASGAFMDEKLQAYSTYIENEIEK